MIVVDTSALMAIVLNESDADRCMAVLQISGRIEMSAATLAECLIVSERRGRKSAMENLISDLGCEIIGLDEQNARAVGDAYALWGKGIHPAGLNYGDCFAYALARERSCPLLFIGNDFSKTDVTPA